jgi:hypothetical protein
LHFPWANQKALIELNYAAKFLEPSHIVQLGDILDCYSYSRFPNSLNITTPEKEIKVGREMAQKFWADMHRAAPDASLHQIPGNHEERPLKQIMRAAPALEIPIMEWMKKLLTFDGVQSIYNPQDELEINGTIFHHGWSCTPGFHVRHFLQSTIHGHTHHANLTFLLAGLKLLFEMDCGMLADQFARPLLYRNSATCKWTPGFGFWDALGPRFCPL